MTETMQIALTVAGIAATPPTIVAVLTFLASQRADKKLDSIAFATDGSLSAARAEIEELKKGDQEMKSEVAEMKALLRLMALERTVEGHPASAVVPADGG